MLCLSWKLLTPCLRKVTKPGANISFGFAKPLGRSATQSRVMGAHRTQVSEHSKSLGTVQGLCSHCQSGRLHRLSSFSVHHVLLIEVRSPSSSALLSTSHEGWLPHLCLGNEESRICRKGLRVGKISQWLRELVI